MWNQSDSIATKKEGLTEFFDLDPLKEYLEMHEGFSVESEISVH